MSVRPGVQAQVLFELIQPVLQVRSEADIPANDEGVPADGNRLRRADEPHEEPIKTAGVERTN